MLEARQKEGLFVCVGLDIDHTKLTPEMELGRAGMSPAEAQYWFGRSTVIATSDLVCAYKLNIAFFEALGAEGLYYLKMLIQFIKDHAPGVPIILDAKRGDIGNTNKGYAAMAFEYFGAHAITVNPYMGEEALREQILDHAEKGVIVLCRTSNKGARELQDRSVSLSAEETRLWSLGSRQMMRLFELVAARVATFWNTKGNCALVVGATVPSELKLVRMIVPKMQLLVPGVGAQGGDLEKTVENGIDDEGRGIVINASRSVIFASTDSRFAAAARIEVLRMNDVIQATIAKVMSARKSAETASRH